MPPLERLKLGHRGPPTERNLKPKSARGFRDAYRAAKLVIDQRGEEAATYAGGRADLLLEEGDLDGSGVWRRILAANRGAAARRREDDAPNSRPDWLLIEKTLVGFKAVGS